MIDEDRQSVRSSRDRRAAFVVAFGLASPAGAALGVLGIFDFAPPLAALAAWFGVFVICLFLAHRHAQRVGEIVDSVKRLGDGDLGGPDLSFGVGLGALATALSRLRRQQAALVAEQERRAAAEDALLDALPDPLLIIGPERTVLRANAAARREFGRELMGRNLAAVMRHPALLDAADRVLDGEDGRVIEVATPSPILRQYSVTVEPSPAEATPGALVSLRDVTALKRNERMRTDFIANASHELRTPLSSLIGFIETLQGPARDDADARARFLPIMHEQAARMARLVDGLMSLSRIEMTEHVPPNTAVNVVDTARSVSAAFELRARARGMRIATALPTAGLAVTGDRDELAQVVQNLIDNAIKYGRADSVIDVTVEHRADGDARLLRSDRAGVAAITVRNVGVGVPAEHIPRLTERFYRVDEARSRELGGVGLGLAIVKHIVNRHRGLIEVDSVDGEGAAFRILLPCRTEVLEDVVGKPLASVA